MSRALSAFSIFGLLVSFGGPVLSARADENTLYSALPDSNLGQWESRLKPSSQAGPKGRSTPKAQSRKPAPVKLSKPEGTLSAIAPKLPTDEARYLIVSDEKYLIRFEDEDGAARVAQRENGSAAVTFSPSEVERFQQAVDSITRYRNELRGHCSSVSTRGLGDALDRYLSGLASFHRKALPLVADISESNELMALVVNRSLLTDAPVLIHRYFQYKRLRFKEALAQFKPADERLIQNLVTIASVLKVEISEGAWKRSYGVRDAALESLSIWPREIIFEAANTLSDVREMPCVVRLDAVEPALANSGTSAPSPAPVKRLAE